MKKKNKKKILTWDKILGAKHLKVSCSPSLETHYTKIIYEQKK